MSVTMDVTNQASLDTLEFVPLRFPAIIPRELIESVKGRTFTPEQFVKYQEQQVDNPFNHLFALVAPSKKIEGFLWAESNLLDNTLFINFFSISKEYWGKGKAIDVAVSFVAKLKEKLKAPRVLWCTTNERFFMKHNFRKSKIVLMEYHEDKEDTNGPK